MCETLRRLFQALVAYIKLIGHHQAAHDACIKVINRFRGIPDPIHQRTVQIIRSGIFTRHGKAVVIQGNH